MSGRLPDLAGDGGAVEATGAAAARIVAGTPGETSVGARPPLGAVVGIAVDGRRTTAARGVADPAGAPMTPDLRHDLASVTKVLGTTVAVATLVSRGELTFDTEVRALVPAFGGHPGTTVRHLLAHRAGLPAWQPLYLAPGVREDPWAVLDSLAPDGPLDAAYRYSDLGFLHLGRVVEAVAAEPLAGAVAELALAPLGIPGAGYLPGPDGTAPGSRGDEAERRMVATGDPYPVRWPADGFAWREHLLRGEPNDGNCWHAFGGTAGHAGLFATVDELLTAGRALAASVAGGGPLRPDVALELVRPGPDPAQALGLRRDGPWAWHPGYTGCAIGFLPGRDVVVAVATNRLLADGPPVPTAALWREAVTAVDPDPTRRGAS